jgi:hypothetical protein
MTEYFETSGIFRRFSDLTRKRFPTIFRQLSDIKSESKVELPGREPPFFRIAIRYFTTAPRSHYNFLGSSVRQ